MFQQEPTQKEQSRFARFEGANPARRGSMFGASDHDSWGYEPFLAQHSMQRRDSRNFFAEGNTRFSVEEPQRNPDVQVQDGGGVSALALALPC